MTDTLKPCQIPGIPGITQSTGSTKGLTPSMESKE